ncbi:MAG: LytTR family transcriptional regulator DNA-binding domain-containing protein [Hymenobacteraceae bacterium]|nr:LytTR family transcriptional regulator DNA-binding domain-containing protein [Hymenobacteraceae bacterium]
MKAIVVDDSRLARAELRRLLQQHPEVQILGEAQNADEAQALMEKFQPDLLFLDIQMPGRSGFELLEQLETIPQVIFTTAFNEYAIKAFEHNALDYLLKPVQPQRLAVAMGRVKDQFEENQQQQQPKDVLHEHDQVFVRDGDRCWFVRLSEVKLLEVSGNYSCLYFGKEKPLIQRSLNYMEQRLDPKVFFRVSRQQIVNLKWIERIEPWFSGSLKLYLRDGGELEVSRRQAQRFKELLSF